MTHSCKMKSSNLFKAVLCVHLISSALGQFDVPEPTVEAKPQDAKLPEPIIKSLHIQSDIKYTYAKTLVTSRILNPAEKAQEVTFRVVLPEEAFITGLIMIIKGKEYEAYVKGKEEAKKEYDAAVSAGQGAAHVFQNPRNSKDFTVAINVEPQEKVNFNLTYEELLSRTNRTYRNEINVNPNQIVDDLSVVVNIEDNLNITDVQVPAFSMSNEVGAKEEENKSAKKTILGPNKVRVEWNPTVKEQIALNKDGLNGQIIVKYDVDASQNPQQVLMSSDGYFLHILRNDDLPVLNKHVVFVLDASGSMWGGKMDQLKDAMKKILQDLSEADRFSILLFSEQVAAWSPQENFDFDSLSRFDSNEPANIIPKDDYVIQATKGNISKAVEFINTLHPTGGTNIMGGLRNGIRLANKGLSLSKESDPQESMIIFLTDGQPNSEESDPEKIVANVDRDNNGVTIFTLGFGDDADMNFLKKLSLSNNGFARKIYTGSDASIQLQNFYKEVASPILSDVKFEYLPDQVENTTSDYFKNLFSGSELLVIGKVKPEGKLGGDLVANSKTGVRRFPIPIDDILILPPQVPHPEKNRTHGQLEKMWAYKTIKTLLDKNTVSKNETLENKAKELALKYSFVTPLTSLVVVKPNDSNVVDEQKGHENFPEAPYLSNSFGAGFGAPAAGSGGFAGGYPASAMGLPGQPFMGPRPMVPMSPPMYNQNQPEIELLEEDRVEYDTTMMYSTTVPPFPTNNPSSSLHYSAVSWLNQTISEDGLYLQPPSSLQTSDVVALNETDVASQKCSNGNICRHFVNCVLQEFIDDVTKFIPYQCHIDPRFLGVCCPF